MLAGAPSNCYTLYNVNSLLYLQNPNEVIVETKEQRLLIVKNSRRIFVDLLNHFNYSRS